MTFTKQQCSDWKRFEAVWSSGRFNMWLLQTRAAAKLSEKRYLFVLKHYVELRDQVMAQQKERK